MRVLFDNGTPRGLASALSGHVVEEARSRGWDTLRNGELLESAERAGFEVFVTTDRNLRYQQNLTGRTVAIIVLGNGRWRLIRARISEITAVVNAAKAGAFIEVEIPVDGPRDLLNCGDAVATSSPSAVPNFTAVFRRFLSAASSTSYSGNLGWVECRHSFRRSSYESRYLDGVRPSRGPSARRNSDAGAEARPGPDKDARNLGHL